MDKKYAVITMDVEDWYHTGYLDKNACDQNFSILNAVDWFVDCLEANGASATFFVLGELVQQMSTSLNKWSAKGFEIASHGWSHTPPVKLTDAQFSEEIHLCMKAHKDYLSAPLEGYRAPLFKINRPHLDQVMNHFVYDSSSTARGRSESQFDLSDFTQKRAQIFQRKDFFEFQVGAPGLSSYFINGGGGTRLLPWMMTEMMLRKFLRQRNFYSFYVHPLDISTQTLPLPEGLSKLARVRMLKGRRKMMTKFEGILHALIAEGYEFITFSELRRKMILEPGKIAI